MCKGRLGSKWDRLSKAGIKEIMNTWEHGIKPQFKSPTTRKEYIIPLPAEAFRGKSSGSLDDKTREPYIKNGRIHYQGYAFFFPKELQSPFSLFPFFWVPAPNDQCSARILSKRSRACVTRLRSLSESRFPKPLIRTFL